jgi:GNAT superfamily N-acetyltransferase
VIAIDGFSTDRQRLYEFVTLAEKIYRSDSYWIAPSQTKLLAQLSCEIPFFGPGLLQHFLARQGKEPLGRVSVMINRRAVEQAEPVGYFGFFECVDDHRVAQKLLEASLDWFHQQKMKTVRGPINGSTWHSYRLMTKGFEHAPFWLEPYNPAYYPHFLERCGFQVKKKYYSTRVTYHERQIRSAEAKSQFIQAAGYNVRPLALQRFTQELKLLYDLSVSIFKNNWGYTEIAWEEFRALYEGLDRVVDQEMVLFALDPHKNPIGFVFAVPDYAYAMRQMRGASHLWAKLRFALAKRQPRRSVIVKTLGVIPEARHTGIGSVLVALVHQYAQQQGYTEAIHALMSEENISLKISEKASEPYKEYAVYEIKI